LTHRQPSQAHNSPYEAVLKELGWIKVRKWPILTQGYITRFNIKHCHAKICTRFDFKSFSAASKAPIEAYQHQTMSKLGASRHKKRRSHCRSAM
jgi:hypothetical protein